MKKNTGYLLVGLVSLFALVTSCGGATTPGGGTGPSVISGSIEVSSVSDWAHLKIGLFSDATYDYLGNSNLDADPGKNYRIYHTDYASGAPASFSLVPVVGSSFSLGNTSSATASFTFTFPSVVPPSGEHYDLVAWIDADDDGTLDLPNASGFIDPVAATQGELNRLAWMTHIEGGTSTTMYFMSFYRSFLTDTKFMATGYDGDMNYIDEVSSAGYSSGFNFHLVPTSGTVNGTAVTGW